jgi:hypothetical protein
MTKRRALDGSVSLKMRWLAISALAAVGVSMAAPARAQTSVLPASPNQATSLPPLQKQWQQDGTPPLQQAPAASGIAVPNGSGLGLSGIGTLRPTAPTATNSGPGGQTQPPPVAPPATVERPNVWLSATVAKLQALDKVNAQATALSVKVGQSATFGSLTITVKACMTRPADQPADAAAYLDVTDSHPDQPGFDGWMLQDEPAVSMMQHPIYDLRVTGCT